MTTPREIIAVWQHKGGSRVTLCHLEGQAYTIDAPGSGGLFYAADQDIATAEVQTRVNRGYYSRDAWKTGYERVGV